MCKLCACSLLGSFGELREPLGSFGKLIAGGFWLLASFESSPCGLRLSFLAGIEKSKGGTRSLKHLKHVAREGGRVWLGFFSVSRRRCGKLLPLKGA